MRNRSGHHINRGHTCRHGACGVFMLRRFDLVCLLCASGVFSRRVAVLSSRDLSNRSRSSSTRLSSEARVEDIKHRSMFSCKVERQHTINSFKPIQPFSTQTTLLCTSSLKPTPNTPTHNNGPNQANRPKVYRRKGVSILFHLYTIPLPLHLTPDCVIILH